MKVAKALNGIEDTSNRFQAQSRRANKELRRHERCKEICGSRGRSRGATKTQIAPLSEDGC